MHNMKKAVLVQCMQHYYLFYICLCISFQLSRQCGPGAGVNHYSNVKKSILRRQPDLHETSIHASGEFTRPIPRDDPRLEPPVITTEIVFENYDLKSEARKAIEVRILIFIFYSSPIPLNIIRAVIFTRFSERKTLTAFFKWIFVYY